MDNPTILDALAAKQTATNQPAAEKAPRLVKASIPLVPIDFDQAKRDVDEFASERNVPTQVYPQVQPKDEGRGATKVAPRSHVRKFTVEFPDYVIDAIYARAAQARPRTTAKYVMLEALQALGIAIAPADMVPDARRSDG